MEHTGGKWIESIPHVIQGDEPKFKFILSSKTVGDVGEYHSNKEMGIDEAEANAKLIAAAPHMFSKCEEIYHDITIMGDETIEDFKTMLEAARAKALSAINKATI